jgi:hypothetical protein
MSVDLARLRLLAQEPPRTAMTRKQQFPSLTDAVYELKQENTALRRGLNEAIAEIERMAHEWDERYQDYLSMPDR